MIGFEHDTVWAVRSELIIIMIVSDHRDTDEHREVHRRRTVLTVFSEQIRERNNTLIIEFFSFGKSIPSDFSQILNKINNQYSEAFLLTLLHMHRNDVIKS